MTLESSNPCNVSASQCPPDLCFLRNATCIDRSLSVNRWSANSWRLKSLNLAIFSDECQCTSDGFSGGIDTGVIGCTRDISFIGIKDSDQAFCYVSGGAASKCPCTYPSTVFPKAAFRLCASCESIIHFQVALISRLL